MISDEYYQAIVHRIGLLCNVSPSFLIALKPLLKVYKFPNAEFILRRGRKAKFAWFVIQGYVREVNTANPAQLPHTTWFWYPHDFVFAYPVFFSQKEAITDIEVLPNTILLELSFDDFMSLKVSYPEVSSLIDELKFYEDKARIDHQEDLFNLSGKQKYDKFYKSHAALFNVAKHKDIASFLGLKDIGFRRYYSLLA